MTRRLSKSEIIDETVSHYTSQNRAVRHVVQSGGVVTNPQKPSCVYHDPKTGNECAVGRCLIDSKEFTRAYGSGALSVLVIDDFEKRLKPQYCGHSRAFWIDLQVLHDDEICWDEEGLSEWGEMQAKKLRNKWCN